MILWRISNHVDLSGLGGLRAGGRWHTRGRPVVYLSESPATALLEILVHLEVDVLGDPPASYRLLRIEAPDEMPTADLADALPADWTEQQALSRAAGDAWLASAATALARVPSAVVPFVHNVLLNPLHPAAATIRIRDVHEIPFDRRLFRPR